MLSKLLGFCFHSNYTWPQTIRGVTYVCCLECGRELPYDFEALGTILAPPKVTAPRRLFIDTAGMRYEAALPEGWDG
jgi:hypothetical protein